MSSQSPLPARVVLLCGPSGSGKSLLAARSGLPVLRLDDFYKEGDDPTLPLVAKSSDIDWDHPHSWDADKAVTAIEDLCRQQGLQFVTEHNEGRIRVEIGAQAGNVGYPAPGAGGYGQQQQGQYANQGHGVQQPQQAYHPQTQPSYTQPAYGGQQQQAQGQQQQQQQGWEQYNTPQNRRKAMNLLSRLFRMLCK